MDVFFFNFSDLVIFHFFFIELHPIWVKSHMVKSQYRSIPEVLYLLVPSKIRSESSALSFMNVPFTLDQKSFSFTKGEFREIHHQTRQHTRTFYNSPVIRSL